MINLKLLCKSKCWGEKGGELINPLRMRRRVTVVCLSVCVCVCMCVCVYVCMSFTALTARVLNFAVQAW